MAASQITRQPSYVPTGYTFERSSDIAGPSQYVRGATTGLGSRDLTQEAPRSSYMRHRPGLSESPYGEERENIVPSMEEVEGEPAGRPQSEPEDAGPKGTGGRMTMDYHYEFAGEAERKRRITIPILYWPACLRCIKHLHKWTDKDEICDRAGGKCLRCKRLKHFCEPVCVTEVVSSGWRALIVLDSCLGSYTRK